MSTKACVVDFFLRAPYWLLSILLPMFCVIQDPTNDSSSFPSVEVSEIGLRSASMDCGGLTFGTGIILASFHVVGTKPSRIEALKIAHTGPDR